MEDHCEEEGTRCALGSWASFLVGGVGQPPGGHGTRSVGAGPNAGPVFLGVATAMLWWPPGAVG